ncbi:UPF0398 protein [Schleiferilactobacillus shenzhenensis LY-73]|uniref:UPF0398 protein L248_0341 n=1 Tax=Schleiferilactobacillus shenzhenensis LY-73 TaxID=1231336 RepID=U4TZC4_9LACO|nr:UPF0398 protein [Schleiferilactobacillus shenzhenensis LY-73]
MYKKANEGLERVWITGYRSYELGVYGTQDPKLQVIQYLLDKTLRRYVDDGLRWVISGGQLGIEQWALSSALAIKADLGVPKTAMMLPFTDFGQKWNEDNQGRLAALKGQVDFSASVSASAYQSWRQLRAYQTFMLTHTDGAILVYDPEQEGKPKYDYDIITKYQETTTYPMELIDFYTLQDAANEYEESQRPDTWDE